MTKEWLSFRYSAWTLALPLISILVLLQLSSLPQRLDFWLYDFLTTTWPQEPADDVVLIAIDEHSLGQIGPWPWPRSSHAALVRQLDRAGADTIVFDVLFPESRPADAELADAMSNHGRVVLPLYFVPRREGELISEQAPVPSLLEAAFAVGHAHVELDQDGIARGLYLYNGLGNELWPALGLAAHATEPVRQPLARPALAAPAYINTREDYRAVPLAGRSGSFPTYSYSEVLQGSLPPATFADKTVFIGSTAAGLGDALPTPFSALARPMSGVEFHANVYSARAQGQLIERIPGSLGWLLPMLVMVLTVLILPRTRPSRTFGFCAVTMVVVAAAASVGILYLRLWLPVASALLVPVVAFPVWSARRLSLANHFLNRQIDHLERGNQLSLPQPGTHHPARILDALRTILQVDQWYLSEDDEVLSRRGLVAAHGPEADVPPGQWHHRDGESWVILERGPRRYHLGLVLPRGLARAAGERYLSRLNLQPEPETGRVVVREENLSTRINRVKRATLKLANVQEFIWRSFEHMPDGIIVTDSLGMILFANGHVPAWFAEPAPSLNRMPLATLLQGHDPRKPSWAETVAETLTLQGSRTVDLRLRKRDFLIHFAPFLLPGSNQNGIIANISDISELREQQRQHREAIDFISHDVRSPLVSQLALIEQLKRHPGEIQPEQLEQLGRLARRSYHLAEEFVQLARAEQLSETRFYDCEFLAIVENARDSVSEQALEKGIYLVLQGNDDIWLKGNAELLERAVINLLTNAVQYSGEDSTITIQVFTAGHQACLTITDEGAGIDPGELPFLFDRFRRQRSSELSGNHGTGLGLSFVNVVVEKHRGDISVFSTPGEGSAFTLRLPISQTPPR